MNEYNKIIAKINNDEFFPIYILVGDENYFADNIIKLLTSKVVNNDSKDFDYFKFYGNEISEDQVIDAAKRFPLVGEYNFVVLKDAKSISKNFDKLTSYVESPNLKTILVLSFINQSLDKRKRIYSLSKKNGLAFESKKIYDNQIFNWINEVALNMAIKYAAIDAAATGIFLAGAKLILPTILGKSSLSTSTIKQFIETEGKVNKGLFTEVNKVKAMIKKEFNFTQFP